MSAKKAYFITVEGCEGVGKSTAMDRISEYLYSQGINVLETREPGGTELGEAIRQLLLTNKQYNITAETELMLMYSARLQHYQQIIKPALEDGRWVLSDRFSDASFAYQGGGRGIAHERIKTLQQWCLGDFTPDLTILLDTPVEVGQHRIEKRKELDRIELEQSDFFQRVRQSYLVMAQADKQRFQVIDANQKIQQVGHEIQRVLNNFLKDKSSA